MNRNKIENYVHKAESGMGEHQTIKTIFLDDLRKETDTSQS